MRLVEDVDFRGLSKWLKKGLREKFEDLALFIIDDNVDRIHKMIAFDGAPQKQNKPSTMAKKGHPISLLDSGLLMNRERYRIYSNQNGLHVTVRPPAARVRILKILRRRGYRYWGISTATRQYANKELDIVFENAKRRVT